MGFCHQSKKHNFLVIGHAGGDPLGHCENTLEATRSALKLGANAIEVDIAISKDDVIFFGMIQILSDCIHLLEGIFV